MTGCCGCRGSATGPSAAPPAAAAAPAVSLPATATLRFMRCDSGDGCVGGLQGGRGCLRAPLARRLAPSRCGCGPAHCLHLERGWKQRLGAQKRAQTSAGLKAASAWAPWRAALAASMLNELQSAFNEQIC